MNSRLLLQLQGLVEGLADQVERRKAWFLAGFSALYLTVTCLVASRKPLWSDELYTLYIARLPGISDVWGALSTGAEQLPPFFYVLTRASLALFGASELALRLPEVIGFWVMSLCLFRFVSKRAPAVYGFLAMLFPLVTGAYYYAHEARPYGLVLGFSALALLCWQSAAEREGHLLSLAGLAGALAAAVSCHYYAVFVFIPLAFAEVVRSFSLRRVGWAVWVSLSLGMTPLLTFLPLIQQAMGYSSTFWSKSRWMSIPEFYFFLLSPAAMPLMAMLVLSALYPATDNSHRKGDQSSLAPPLHEMAAASAFMAIPVVAVALSMLLTSAFTDRYALPAVIGCSLIFAFAARKLLYDRPAIAATLALSLAVLYTGLAGIHLKYAARDRADLARAEQLIRSKGADGLPIAPSDLQTFMELAYYGPPDIVSRLVYLADPEASLRHLGHHSVEKGVLDLLKPRFGLKVEEYERFMARGQRFLVYGKADHILNWLFSELAAAGVHVELRGRDNDALLFLVSPETKGEAPAADSSAGSPSNRTSGKEN
jgi:Dolichyl-phosphate-mannose-protein mannosyltransferase